MSECAGLRRGRHIIPSCCGKARSQAALVSGQKAFLYGVGSRCRARLPSACTAPPWETLSSRDLRTHHPPEGPNEFGVGWETGYDKSVFKLTA